MLPAWFIDGDGDGYGDPGTAVFNCVQPSNYIPTGEDCDNTDSSVSPEGVEVCNETDDDCDGDVDEDVTPSWWSDEDEDGYGAGEAILACDAPSGTVDNDFDDTTDAVNPVAEDGCNGIDDDCDGDGTDDLLFSSEHATGNGGQSGAFFVMQGPISAASYDTSSVMATIEGPSSYSWMDSFAVGDLSGNGVDDVVVGARGSDSYATNAGSVYLFNAGSY
ncbi:MAG: hypothetical protein GY913_06350 [Proteobacteria bacterium]|nr:hypothetical protein [Pseudomonadota bacterium]